MAVKVTNNAIKVTNILRKGMFEAVRDACLHVERMAKENITNNGNINKGHLRTSISTDVDFSSKQPYARVGSELEYAKYIEFGTGLYAENGNGRKTPWGYENEKGETVFTWGSRPYPFLRPAIDDHMDEVKQIIESRIKNAMIEDGVSI
jgi:HK97 gp10 family phage protein